VNIYLTYKIIRIICYLTYKLLKDVLKEDFALKFGINNTKMEEHQHQKIFFYEH